MGDLEQLFEKFKGSNDKNIQKEIEKAIANIKAYVDAEKELLEAIDKASKALDGISDVNHQVAVPEDDISMEPEGIKEDNPVTADVDPQMNRDTTDIGKNSPTNLPPSFSYDPYHRELIPNDAGFSDNKESEKQGDISSNAQTYDDLYRDGPPMAFPSPAYDALKSSDPISDFHVDDPRNYSVGESERKKEVPTYDDLYRDGPPMAFPSPAYDELKSSEPSLNSEVPKEELTQGLSSKNIPTYDDLYRDGPPMAFPSNVSGEKGLDSRDDETFSSNVFNFLGDQQHDDYSFNGTFPSTSASSDDLASIDFDYHGEYSENSGKKM